MEALPPPDILAALLQVGGMGAVAFLLIQNIGTKLDRLTGAVGKMHEKLAILIDRRSGPEDRRGL